jgi:L-threonylcarbamoyladenylate synthase
LSEDCRAVERLRVDPHDPDSRAIARAAEALRGGGLVVFPTETVYGLGANALDAGAVARVFAAKGRPAINPVIVHVRDVAAARALARAWPPAAERLAAAFWPGPLTLVVQKRAEVPAIVTAGLDAVGVRVPAHPVALALLAAAGVPVAAPSANRSGALSPSSADQLDPRLLEAVDVVLDAGPAPVGIESAVVDVTGDTPRLLRPGTLAAAELARAAHAPALELAGVQAGEGPRPAPGMLERHYAPRAELALVDARDPAGVALARARAAAERARGGRVAHLGFGELPLEADEARRLDPLDALGAARALYRILHEFDQGRATLVIAELPPEGEAWAGVRDRLRRAATRP